MMLKVNIFCHRSDRSLQYINLAVIWSSIGFKKLNLE